MSNENELLNQAIDKVYDEHISPDAFVLEALWESLPEYDCEEE